MNFDKFTLLTATFNRHDFTISMLKSFVQQCKWLPNCIILDNSTECAFPTIDNKFVKVVDNTNFKLTPDYKQPSKNHCASLDYALTQLVSTPYCILCDNDVLFKPSVTALFDKILTHNMVGEIGYDRVPPARLYPYFCIIDITYMKTHHIRYFDENRCMVDNAVMDTGCSFLNDMQQSNATIYNIKLSDYIVHLKGGTLHNRPITELFNRGVSLCR